MKTDLLLAVSEVFHSIQGESSLAGYPCVFIRLAGCNLRCAYCDSRYTFEEPGEERPLSELLAATDRHPGAIIEITGGEPLLQDNVYPLMEALLVRGRTVLLETNGSLSLARVPREVVRILDLKCPDSGMTDRMDFANLARLSPHDEIKFVLSSRADYDWATDILRRHNLHGRAGIIFSPASPLLDPPVLAGWLLEDNLPVRLQLQLHTVLWPERSRGV